MKKIKNIVLDLGGVILGLDVPKTIEALKELGIKNIVNKTGHHYEHSFFYDFEIGKISEESFLNALKGLSNQPIHNNQIKDAWNKMILNMPKHRVDFLYELKSKYTLFLLSNTNSIHQKKYLDQFKEDYKTSFNQIFEKAYYSNEIGIRKPNRAVFDFVLNDSNLKPEETLFIDDALSNIEGAQAVGIQTYHVQNFEILNVVKLLDNN